MCLRLVRSIALLAGLCVLAGVLVAGITFPAVAGIGLFVAFGRCGLVGGAGGLVGGRGRRRLTVDDLPAPTLTR